MAQALRLPFEYYIIIIIIYQCIHLIFNQNVTIIISVIRLFYWECSEPPIAIYTVGSMARIFALYIHVYMLYI